MLVRTAAERIIEDAIGNVNTANRGTSTPANQPMDHHWGRRSAGNDDKPQPEEVIRWGSTQTLNFLTSGNSIGTNQLVKVKRPFPETFDILLFAKALLPTPVVPAVYQLDVVWAVTTGVGTDNVTLPYEFFGSNAGASPPQTDFFFTSTTALTIFRQIELPVQDLQIAATVSWTSLDVPLAFQIGAFATPKYSGRMRGSDRP